MHKGKPFAEIWKLLKQHKNIILGVHEEDVTRFKKNLSSNKLRDLAFNCSYPLARLIFTYDLPSKQLNVKLSLTPYDDIPLEDL